MKRFKEYAQNQILLLPPSLEEILEPNDLARVVNLFVEKLDMRLFDESFRGGGCPSYHPLMMLKILIYAYCRKLYSSRQISLALRRDIGFMWLSGMQRPDFNTVNRFRSVYLKEVFEQVFAEIVQFLLEHGYVESKDYFVDGTKIEANAGKFTHVWRKNTERYKEKIKQRAKELLAEIDQLNKAEDIAYDGKDLPEYGEDASASSEDLQAVAERINEKLKSRDKKSANEMKCKAKELKKIAKKLSGYEAQTKILGTRNSYSKTDTDATFMRPKNSFDEILPLYNVQMGTENGFVMGFSVHQNSNDARNFKEHLTARKNAGLPTPKRVVGDSIYGTEENYQELKDNHIESYLKYPTFHRELSNKIIPFSKADFSYQPRTDTFICPAGRSLPVVDTDKNTLISDFVSQVKIYQCSDCSGCTQREQCCKGAGNRTIQRNERLEAFMLRAKKNLTSQKGLTLRRRRGNEIESIFGDIKFNQRFRRFNLRGLTKVNAETALLAISVNIRKFALLQHPTLAKA